MKKIKSIYESYLLRNHFFSDNDFKNLPRLQGAFFKQYSLLILFMIEENLSISQILERLSEDPYFSVGYKTFASFKRFFYELKNNSHNEFEKIKHRIDLVKIMEQLHSEPLLLNKEDSVKEITVNTIESSPAIILEKIETKNLDKTDEIPFYLKNKKQSDSVKKTESRDLAIPRPKLPLTELSEEDSLEIIGKSVIGVYFDSEGWLFDSFTADDPKDYVPIPDYLQIKRNDDKYNNSLYYMEEENNETNYFHSNDLLSKIEEKLKFGKNDFSYKFKKI